MAKRQLGALSVPRGEFCRFVKGGAVGGGARRGGEASADEREGRVEWLRKWREREGEAAE